MVARPLAPSLPWLLLAFSLSSLFVFGGDRERFYRPNLLHDWNTAMTLTLASNLSLEHNLRLFLRQQPGQDGEPRYDMYSRFPLGSYALVKLATLPFEDDLQAEMLAARMLMLALFCGAALLACLALRRIAADPWIALAATLLAFASFRLLYYSDAVAQEKIPDLFAVMLVFHGMVIHAQDGRFAQLVAKTCLALLMGWHVYALLLAFIALSFVAVAADAVAAWRTDRGTGDKRSVERTAVAWACLRAAAAALVRSRLPTLGVVALLFGVAMLSFNVATEHAALKGEVRLAELPSVESMLRKFGQEAEHQAKWARELAWPTFLFRQIHAVGTATIPYALPVPKRHGGDLRRRGLTGFLVAGVGLLAAGACLLGLFFARRPRRDRVLLGALALSGFAWGLPMRNNTAMHEFEGLFYVGTPLAAYTLLFLLARRRFGRWLPLGAVVAMLAFVLSCREMGRLTVGSELAELSRAQQMDFQRMREKTPDKTVFVDGIPDRDSHLAVQLSPPVLAYYLAGSVVQYDPAGEMGNWPRYRLGWANRNHRYDLILSRKRLDHPSLLTPDNQLVFLYDGSAFARAHDFYLPAYRAQYEAVAAREPAAAAAAATGAHAAFDVYVAGRRGRRPAAAEASTGNGGGGGDLFYLRAPCVDEDAQGVFFVHVVPRQQASLPAGRRQLGFDNLDFRFADHGVVFEGRCLARIALPAYDIAQVGTGRSLPDGSAAWRVDFKVDD